MALPIDPRQQQPLDIGREGPSPRPEPPNQIGVSKRQKMEDDMRRRGLLRKVQEISQRNPRILQQVAARSGRGKAATDPALAQKFAPPQQAAPMGRGGNSPDLTPGYDPGSSGLRGGGGGRGGHGGGNAFPGSPAYVGRDWGVSPEERAMGDAAPGGGVAGFNLPGAVDPTTGRVDRSKLSQVMFTQSPADLAREQEQRMSALRDWQSNVNYPEMKALQARIDSAGQNADVAMGGGNAGEVAKATARQGAAVAGKAQQEIEKLKYQRAGVTDPDKLAELDAKIEYQQQFLNQPVAAAPAATAPVADMANRESWSIDPNLQSAMLTNRPDVLAGAKRVLSPADQALQAKYGPATLTASHAQPMGAVSYAAGEPVAAAAPAEVDPEQAQFEADLAALKEKKAKKSAKSESKGSAKSEG